MKNLLLKTIDFLVDLEATTPRNSGDVRVLLLATDGGVIGYCYGCGYLLAHLAHGVELIECFPPNGDDEPILVKLPAVSNVRFE